MSAEIRSLILRSRLLAASRSLPFLLSCVMEKGVSVWLLQVKFDFKYLLPNYSTIKPL